MNKLLNWATGAGKSRVALELVGPSNLGFPHTTLVLVPERQSIQGWHDEIQKWLPAFDDSITVKCYASLHKHTNTKWVVLVLDECHRLMTNKRVFMLDTIKADNVIASSATPGNSLTVLECMFG